MEETVDQQDVGCSILFLLYMVSTVWIVKPFIQLCEWQKDHNEMLNLRCLCSPLCLLTAVLCFLSLCEGLSWTYGRRMIDHRLMIFFFTYSLLGHRLGSRVSDVLSLKSSPCLIFLVMPAAELSFLQNVILSFQLKGPNTVKLADCTELWNFSSSTELESHKHLASSFFFFFSFFFYIIPSSFAYSRDAGAKQPLKLNLFVHGWLTWGLKTDVSF